MRLENIATMLSALLVGQRANWPCWLAIALGSGVLVYFALPFEPSLPWVAGGLLVCAVACVLARLAPRGRPLLWGLLPLFIITLGFTAACWRTAQLHPHFLGGPLKAAPVTGRVAEIEPLPAGVRLTLDPAYLGRSPEAMATPLKLQVTVLTQSSDIAPGNWVWLRADLHPPSGPAMPGAFDFRRQAFFAGVDGVGFSYLAKPAFRTASLAETAKPRWLGDWADGLRQRIAQRIAGLLPDESGALAIALVVGNQTAMRKADMAAMRDSGLAHLLSISGLHISLAAGIMFFSCRLIFALIPWLALRIATKKWAAVLALIGATFYAILAGAAESSLSGSVVPTQRSLLMVLIAFSAILIDRSPVSLRLVAWSAVLLLLWQPESLIGPSFQMSFAAVFALIACFEALRPFLQRLREFLSVPPVDLGGRLLGYGGYAAFWLIGLMLSSLIASLATAPFGLYHFDRLQIYGIAANMLAVPLTGIWLMPAAVLALLLMPLGLDAPFWHLLGWGCDVVLWIGRSVQDWPQAVMPVAAMPVWGLVAASLGLIWICLGKGWGRAVGLVGFVLMGLSIATLRQPDILLSESGRLIAVRSPAGPLVVSSNRPEKRVRETWLRRRAQEKSGAFSSLDDNSSWFSCTEPAACQVQLQGQRLLFDLGTTPNEIDCAAVNFIIVPARQITCDGNAGRLIIDQPRLARMGAVAIYLGGDSTRVDTVADDIGNRPWSAFNHADDASADDNADDDGTPGAAQ